MEIKREQRRLVDAATDAAMTLQERVDDFLKSREVKNTRKRVMHAVEDLSKSDAIKTATQKLQEAREQLARSERLHKASDTLHQTAGDVKESEAVKMAALNLEEAAHRISKSETLREAEYHLRNAADELGRSKTAKKAQKHLRKAADDLSRTRMAKEAGAKIDEATAAVLASETGKLAIKSYDKLTGRNKRPSRAFWLVLLSIPFTALIAFILKSGKQGEMGLDNMRYTTAGDLSGKAHDVGREIKSTAHRIGDKVEDKAHDLANEARSSQYDSTYTAGGTEELRGKRREPGMSGTSDISNVGLDERQGMMSGGTERNLPMEENVPSSPNAAMKAGTDNLEIIEGIGPRIAGVLNAAGITTFQQLQGTSVDRLQEILREAGIWGADPATWAEQARLIMAGNQDNLEALQNQLRGGRKTE